jgi:hypothetical protein
LFVCLFGYLVVGGWLVGCLTGWLVGWLFGWLVSYLVSYSYITSRFFMGVWSLGIILNVMLFLLQGVGIVWNWAVLLTGEEHTASIIRLENRNAL